MLNISKVSELMTENPITVTPQDDVDQALDYMRERKIRHVPVVDVDGELLGVISERDILNASIVSISPSDRDSVDEESGIITATKVDEIYTRTPETIDEDALLADAARTILENKFGCLPVMRGNELIGILTESDFVKLVLSELEGNDRATAAEEPAFGRNPS